MRRFCLLIALVIGLGSASAQEIRVFVRHAKGFTVEYGSSYKLVTVTRPWPGATRTFSYALYPRGGDRPTVPAGTRAIAIPIRRAITFSSTYVAELAALGLEGSIVGVDNGAYVSSPSIQAKIAKGEIKEVTRNWSPNIELLISLKAEAIFAYGVGNEWDQHPKMEEANLPVVMDGEWNEESPLARAEWIKFIALFYGKETEAEAIFSRSEKEYLRLSALAAKATVKPLVIVNAPFQGNWTISGGRSYMAAFIADAGGAYVLSEDKSTGGVIFSVESAYIMAQKADFWLNPGSATSIADLESMDRRFARLPVIRSCKVYNNDARLGPSGANDYYETGSISPDRILRDLIAILHPELLPGEALVYYRRLK